jgi:hypothetical protein
MNAKVQRCWVTPSQPSEEYVDGGEDGRENSEVGVRVTMRERRQEWDQNREFEKNFTSPRAVLIVEVPTVRPRAVLIVEVPTVHFCFLPLPSLFHPHLYQHKASLG